MNLFVNRVFFLFKGEVIFVNEIVIYKRVIFLGFFWDIWYMWLNLYEVYYRFKVDGFLVNVFKLDNIF